MFIRLKSPDVPGAGCEAGYEADGCDQSLIASQGILTKEHCQRI